MRKLHAEATTPAVSVASSPSAAPDATGAAPGAASGSASGAWLPAPAVEVAPIDWGLARQDTPSASAPSIFAKPDSSLAKADAVAAQEAVPEPPEVPSGEVSPCSQPEAPPECPPELWAFAADQANLVLDAVFTEAA
eukprot:g3400.t1